MKKLLLSAAFIAATSFVMNAQTTVYNFGQMYGAELEAAGSSTLAIESKGDLIVINNAKKVVIESNKKMSEGVLYTHRLKLGGKSTVDASTGLPKDGSFGIPVTGPGTIKFVVLTGSNSDLTRTIDYAFVGTDGSKESGTTGLTGGVIDTDKVTVDGTEMDHITPLTWDYTGGAGHVYFYSLVNGNNYYAVMYTPAGATSLDKVDAQVVSREYFNLGGMQVNNPTEGVFIVKEILEDGTSKVSKKIIR